MAVKHSLTIFKVNGDVLLEIPADDVHQINFEGSATKVDFALDGGLYESIETTLPCIYRKKRDT